MQTPNKYINFDFSINPVHLTNGEDFCVDSINCSRNTDNHNCVQVFGRDIFGIQYCVPPSLVKEFNGETPTEQVKQSSFPYCLFLSDAQLDTDSFIARKLNDRDYLEYQMLRRKEELILVCREKGLELIDWHALHDLGKLALVDYFYFPFELQTYKDEGIKDYLGRGGNQETVDKTAKELAFLNE